MADDDRNMTDEQAEALLRLAHEDTVLGCEVKAYVERLKERAERRDSIISGLLGLLGLPLEDARGFYERLLLAETPEDRMQVFTDLRNRRERL